MAEHEGFKIFGWMPRMLKLETGGWRLVAGYWSLVSGCWVRDARAYGTRREAQGKRF
jgi:hypothetical protein